MSEVDALGYFPYADATRSHAQTVLGSRRRGWLIRRSLLLADVVGLSVAFVLAETVSSSGGGGSRLGRPAELVVAAATLPLWVFAGKLYGLYDRDEERTDHSTVDEFVSVFHLITVCSWLFFVIAWLSGLADPDIVKLAVFWGIATGLVTVGRAIARTACRHHISYVQNTIVVGAGDIGQIIARKLLQHPEYGINVVGFVDSEPKERHEGLEHLALLGAPQDVPRLCRVFDVERVVIAFSRQDAHETLDLVRSLRDLDVQIDLVPRLFEILGPCASMHSVEGLPLVGLPPVHLTRSSRVLKRSIDIVLAALMLVLTLPVFAAVTCWIRLTSPGPVFFGQRRLGHHMREFTAWKFRTMHADADPEVHRDYIRRTMDRSTPATNGRYKLARANEITTPGRFLRKTSLDELPQLINVLRGEMSLVGPRPCIAYETEFFEPHHFERFLVPQGLTGLWQVTARTKSTFAEALDMDVAYARNWSLDLDIKLLLKTPLQLVRLRGSA